MATSKKNSTAEASKDNVIDSKRDGQDEAKGSLADEKSCSEEGDAVQGNCDPTVAMTIGSDSRKDEKYKALMEGIVHLDINSDKISPSRTSPSRSYKKTLDSSATAHGKRVEAAVTIRKHKKENKLMKLRRAELPCESSSPNVSTQLSISEYAKLLLTSEALEDQKTASTGLRRLLSLERDPPVDEVVAAGCVPRFVQFLEHVDPTVQFESAWALTNIASGTSENTQVIVESGACPIFVRLLRSPNEDLTEQCVWALGNIAGDSPNHRDYVLSLNAVDFLCVILNEPRTKLSTMRNTMWTLSNLCRGRPPPDFGLVAPALPTLARVICTSADEEILTDACWALSYLSDSSDQNISQIIQTGVHRRVIELTLHGMVSVKTPAVRTLGNFVTGDDQVTQTILDCGALPPLISLMKSEKRAIRKEVCWAISNITAGNTSQIQQIIDHNVVPALLHAMKNDEFDIRKEATWAVANLTSGATDEQIRYLVSCDCFGSICDMLRVQQDTRILIVVLECVQNILRSGDKNEPNPYVELIEQDWILDVFEELHHHPNEQISKIAIKLSKTYFSSEE